MTYSYFGLLFGKAKVALALLTAVVSTGHAAVWLGASDSHGRWVQAGIATVGGERFAYIEINSRRGYSLQEFPTTTSARVHLVSRGGDWRVSIEGHTSRWVWLSRVDRIACLELYGPAHATALIDGRTVSH